MHTITDDLCTHGEKLILMGAKVINYCVCTCGRAWARGYHITSESVLPLLTDVIVGFERTALTLGEGLTITECVVVLSGIANNPLQIEIFTVPSTALRM